MIKDEMATVPVLPLCGMVLLPGMLVHLDVSGEMIKRAIKAAMESDGIVFITNQRDEKKKSLSFDDLFEVGVIAEIRQELRQNENRVRVMISTGERANLLALSQVKPFLVGAVELCAEDKSLEESESIAMSRELRDNYTLYVNSNPRMGRGALEQIQNTEDVGRLTDLIAMNMKMEHEKRQEILESLDIRNRFEIVCEVLCKEIDVARARETYRDRVKRKMEEHQRDHFLREQMQMIREELGDSVDPDRYIEKYRQQLEALQCEEVVYDRIKEEIDRLQTISTHSTEHIVARDYIETLLSLPWNAASEDREDISYAESVLEKDHYGLQKVKERILEFLAVRTLTNKAESPILCLVGPPGTGKTSIARSIARALEKKYVRICLGGVRDEAEIRGHRRTYIGSLPGRFVEGLKKAKVKNPLILLDEIDKVGSDHRGDPSSALLEVLDPEQNRQFVDHYVELPVDLSEVLFICTANSTDTIPAPLLDRMEVIRLAGYTENERFHIGKDYLIPKQLEKNGLKKKQLQINDAGLRALIVHYTKEAGVRNLEREIGAVCRKAAKRILDGEEGTVRLNSRNITDFLGKKKYRIEEMKRESEVGIVRGLAWTPVGGDTLDVEVSTMVGEGKLNLTGKLGDVMKESAQIAFSLVRSLLPEREEFFETHDFHVHVPAGAVSKDGPSAGVTMATAIYSAVVDKAVDSKVAMTGEVTLRGRVLAIGGLKEKMLAARVAGVKKVIVPRENMPDVEEFEEEITEGMTIVFADKICDVLNEALVGKG